MHITPMPECGTVTWKDNVGSRVWTYTHSNAPDHRRAVAAGVMQLICNCRCLCKDVSRVNEGFMVKIRAELHEEE